MFVQFSTIFNHRGLLAVSASSDDDMFSSYIGFNNLAQMPHALSHTVAVVIKQSEIVQNSFADVDDMYHIVPEDRIYFFGGCASDQTCTTDGSARTCTCLSVTQRCMFYRPLKNNWGNCASAPIARYRHAWAKLRGKIYIVGGIGADGSIVRKIDIYDPITDSWDVSGIIWSDATGDAAAWGSDFMRSVYVAGGYTSANVALGSVTRIDTVSRTINRDVPNMLHPRGAAEVMNAGTLYYVMGGYETVGKLSSGACSLPTHWNEAFNSLTNKWIQLPDMLYGRAGMATGTNGKNLVFAIAGETVDPTDDTCTKSVPVQNVGLYNITNRLWSTVDDLPSANRFRYTSASYYNGSFTGIYLFGGNSAFDPRCGCPVGVTVGCGAGCFRVSNLSTLYVPVSIYVNHPRKHNRCNTK